MKKKKKGKQEGWWGSISPVQYPEGIPTWKQSWNFYSFKFLSHEKAAMCWGFFCYMLFLLYAIWFWLNANAVIDFYSQLSVFYRKVFWPTCFLVLFTSIRRTKAGQKSLVGQSPIFRWVFLPSWFCTARGVMWDGQNPSLIPVMTSSSQPRWPAAVVPRSSSHREGTDQGAMLPIAGLLQAPRFKI